MKYAPYLVKPHFKFMHRAFPLGRDDVESDLLELMDVIRDKKYAQEEALLELMSAKILRQERRRYKYRHGRLVWQASVRYAKGQYGKYVAPRVNAMFSKLHRIAVNEHAEQNKVDTENLLETEGVVKMKDHAKE